MLRACTQYAANADHLWPPLCSHKLCEFSVRVMGQESGTELKRNLNVVKLLETLRDSIQLIYSIPCKSYTSLNRSQYNDVSQ